MEPKKTEQSRFIKKVEREKLDTSKVNSIIELIHYQSKQAGLTPPLYTAKAQQEANERAALAESKKEPLGTGKQQALSPLMQHELDSYEEMIHYLLKHISDAKEQKELKEDLAALQKMHEKRKFSAADLKRLTKMWMTFNQMAEGLKDGKAKRQYWAKAAMMFEVMSKLISKLEKDPKNVDLKKMLEKMKKAAELNRGIASARADGNESLADLFREAILNHYMPGQEALLTELANLLKFSNEGATMDNDLLDILSDLTNAADDFNLNSLLHGGSKGKFPGGQNIANQLRREKNAVSRDENELKKASSKLDDQIKQLEEEQKGEKNPKIKKMRQKLIDQLKGYQKNIQSALGHLSKLSNLLNQLKVTVNSDGTGSISGPANWQQQLSADEDGVVNGAGDPPTGGLAQIYTQIHGDQQDYSNQSQSQQMELQLTMTEIQQEWTIVSTCMTTLNQCMMTIAQGIYK